MKIIECVPNFSEGNNRRTIEAIAAAVRSVNGVSLMDVDAGAGANRTVYTFAGTPESVFEAAFRSIETASELIDMRAHHGVHPRIGACDVCPFVPLVNATMNECVSLAKRLGERVGRELNIPVYLYANAATRPERKGLRDIRRGEYEGLAEKMKNPEWKPDFGPSEFNTKSGATVIGARPLLVAFNINLDTSDAKAAERIAAEIRESGKGRRRLLSLQAKGWFIPEYGCAQVTTNILDLDQAPLSAVFDACRETAREMGFQVTGSEIVGMVPRRALLDAGRRFAESSDLGKEAADNELIEIAIRGLGLRSVKGFDPKTKVLEEWIKTT